MLNSIRQKELSIEYGEGIVLDKSEKTGNQQVQSQNKLFKAGAGYIIGNYLLKGITFLSAPIFVRLLTTEEYGDFGAYIAYESIFYIILGLALHSSITNAKYEYKEKFNEYVSSLILLSGLSVSIWLIIANVFYNSYSDVLGLNRTVVNILVFHCFGSAIFQLFNVYVGLSYSVKSYLVMTAVNAVSNMGLSIILILTVFKDDRLMGRIIGSAFPIVAIAGYICFYFVKKSKPRINKQYWKYALQYSLPIIPHGISQVILSSFDRIMIKGMVGAAEAGLYSFAGTINLIISVVSSSIDKVWKPWFYEKMDEKDYKLIRKNAAKYVFGFSVFIAMVIMVIPELIWILGTREYWGTTACVVPVVIGGYFSFIYTVPVYVEYFYKKTKYIALGSMLAAVLNVVLNYFFIPQYGYIAAAYTTLITYVLYFIFHYLLARKIHGSSLVSATICICSSLVVCIAGGIAMLLESKIVIRWLIEIGIGVFGLCWAEKNFGLIGLVKQKLKRGI